jgi:crotonobetainyl-CoA:carnitine CoA-transferase CaiB-like acyl-CoA transferase
MDASSATVLASRAPDHGGCDGCDACEECDRFVEPMRGLVACPRQTPTVTDEHPSTASASQSDIPTATSGSASGSASRGALAGVRVLDLTSVVMGPYATQLLGDMGADVICVEASGGDTNRIMGPGPVRGMSGVSMNLLRNKRNVCLDLKQPAARDACLAVLATCDVFVTNLRPAPLQRLGLAYADVAARRPDIVMCRAHGWPSDGPNGNKPAYDDVIQAVSGVAHSFQLRDGVPAMAPTLIADKVAGMAVAQAVLAALFHRERTGDGQLVEVAMDDALRSFSLVEHGCAAIPEPPLGQAGYPRIVTPDRRPYATTDGWIAVLPYSAANYRAVFREGGRDDLLDDPRIEGARSRMAHAGELYAIVAEVVATRSTSFWVDFCDEHDIPAGPVRTLDELVDELPIAEHPIAGRYRQTPVPWRFDRTPTSVRRPAPMLGEHTREVLLEVGLAADAIDSMVSSGAIPAV